LSEIADRFVVVLDANVLYPFRVRDVLLSFAEAGLYRARWSAQILDEWKKKLIQNKPHLEASVLSQEEAIIEAFPEALISGFEPIIPSLNLPDQNDCHVLAAAIVSGAQHIVTENLRDFPADVLGRYGIEAVTADDFLSSTFELYPMPAIKELAKVRQSYDNPAMTQSEFIMDLNRYGLVKTAGLARDMKEFL